MKKIKKIFNKVVKFLKKAKIYISITIGIIFTAIIMVITLILTKKESKQVKKNNDIIENIKKKRKENEKIFNDINDDFYDNPFNKSRDK
jgi:hypothetical protein